MILALISNQKRFPVLPPLAQVGRSLMPNLSFDIGGGGSTALGFVHSPAPDRPGEVHVCPPP